MLLAQNYQTPAGPRPYPTSTTKYSTAHDPIPRDYPETLHYQSDIEQDLDGEYGAQSLSGSPISTQSLLSGFQGSPLSAFQTVAAPRGAYMTPLFDISPQRSRPIFAESTVLENSDQMQTDPWTQVGHLTPRTAGRLSHQRESSLSSLGSNGPASPFPQNFANPQIAVTDSADGFHGLPTNDDVNYQLAKYPITHDNLYTTFTSWPPIDQSSYQRFPGDSTQKRKSDRARLQPDHLIRSHPDSVASSVASDSPATPAEEPEEQRRQRAFGSSVPKLDRTLTDAINDELYNPNLIITRATSSHHTVPHNELFAQTLQAANSQHLSALQSPISATSRNQSPFRQGSPLAMPPHEFPSAAAFTSARQIRERNKAYEAGAAQQQMGRSMDTSTPQTISPKDAMLEFHEAEGENNFPLFHQQHANAFDMETAITKAMSQSQPAFDSIPLDSGFSNYLGNSQLPVQVPQQYPFISHARQQSSVPSLSNGSLATSRVGSAETGLDSHNSSPQRPTSTSAEGGTYTCTYHGCTLRFDTPVLLQKHKREGHRQAHGLGGTRRGDSGGVGMTSALLNSQAGPHKCDRINPSTGKPCNTIFSRPYDLTRHEDTIHNARKQKVRCDLCTDEKTFSRADALTRHYRVCHPDVELHGKHRRRGPQSA